MKKAFKVLALLAACIMLLCSCSGDKIAVPDGMQIVEENKTEGYIFFGPEGWVVGNHGSISSTYLSTTSKTSMTFTKMSLSEGESIGDYFKGGLEKFPYPVTFYKSGAALGEGETAAGERANFGTAEAGASEAYKYVYAYKHGDTDYSCLQMLIRHGERYYVFTYTAQGLPTDGESAYNNHVEKAQAAIDSFMFTAPVTGDAATEPERDESGYILASDKTVSGFALYIPDDYTVVSSSGIAEVKINDNAAITLTRASETGLGVLDYLLNRRAEILKIADSFTDYSIKVAKPVSTDGEYFDNWELEILPVYDSTLCFGELDAGKIAAYEYAYTYKGTTYRVYQVLGADSFYGYVFTYTATESEYPNNFIEIKSILEKVSFK